MFTQNEYFIAWGVYLLGAALCVYCWLMITAKVAPIFIKLLLRTFVAVALFTPWYVDGTAGYLAPAIVAMSIEGLFVSGASFSRAGLPLVSTMLLVCVVASLVYVTWYWVKRK